MKKFFIFALAAATVLTGCKKEWDQNLTPEWNGEGDGYVAFNVSLPSAPATKANDDFDDGTSDEYRVEDIVLVLFTGANEDGAVLASAYNLSDQREAFKLVGGDNHDQITSTTSPTLVAEIRKATITGTKAYAFIILNDHQFVEVDQANADLLASERLYVQSDADQHLGEKYIVVAGGNASLKGMKFSDFKKLALDESGRDFANASFFMSNAPVATKAAQAGWNGELTTLVEFDKDMIKRERQEAIDNPAATINVERALAKVTCEFTTTGTLENNDQIAFTILGWDLDNYNAMGFITRNFNDAAKAGFNGEQNFAPTMSYISSKYQTGNYGYRFSSPLPIAVASSNYPEANTEVYRTYWGQDVNYSNIGETENVTDGAPLNTKENAHLDPAYLRASGTTYYCPENTFDVKHQTVRNTTRLVLAVEINNGEPFFTLQENATTLYPEAAGAGSIHEFLGAAVANRVNVRKWATDYIDVDIDQEGAWASDLFTISFVESLTAAQTGKEAKAAVAGRKYALVTINPQADLAKFKGADNTAKAATRSAAVTSFIEDGLAVLSQSYLANSYNLHYYVGGVAYYQTLIKHFGDYETPWQGTDEMDNTIATIYDGANGERDYLGRYGILRNNWYKLAVTGIRNIGSSVVPPLTDQPDDTVENYMSVRINILPWAIRTQNDIIL